MRYIAGLLLGIGLIVLTFILIFRAFSGGSDEPAAPKVDLISYATTDAVMRYTIDGAVNADQSHYRIRITVSNDQVLYEELQGYQGKVRETKTYPSNTDAYATFLRALALAKFEQGNPEAQKDERGFCPAGRRYIYEGLEGGQSLFRWWSDGCAAADGNFRGSASVVRDLFFRQVPDYSKLSSDVRL